MWLPEAKHGVEPVCLERLGQPRAGRLLQVLRGVGSLRDRHEERKVAVESTEQSCREGQKHSRKHFFFVKLKKEIIKNVVNND